MAAGNVKRGFNRLFIVAAVVWAVYCTIIYPIQQRTEAYHRYETDQRGCYESELGQPQSKLDECLKTAEGLWRTDIDQWSVRNFYIGAWPWILAAIIGLPLTVYGTTRGVTAVWLWVWHGYKDSLP